MGTFTVPIEVGDLKGNLFLAMNALVDANATIYSMVPRDSLDQVGVTIHETREFALPDDSLVECDLGYARFRFEQREVIALVIFAPEGTMPLLGVTTLENIGVGVGPVHERLVPVLGLLRRAYDGNGQFSAGL